jgi:type II secretory pathway predicted ATPase ExeA
MYEKHFGLVERPFNLTPDPRYLFLSRQHQEAFAHLQYGVREKNGFVLLTGEVGTGKTTLLRHFLAQLGPETKTAVVLYPALSAGDLFHSILEDLGVPFSGGTLRQAVQSLHAFLLDARARGLFVAVVIDEAQTLHPKVLEQLRLLSNLETERDKLLTIVLCGQPELRALLARDDLRQLAQRIGVRAHLEPLTVDDSIDYVQHRLRVAGGTGDEVAPEAIRRMAALAGGVPRLLNLLSDRALLGAFALGQSRVSVELVERAGEETLPQSGTRTGGGLSFSRGQLLAAAATVLGALAWALQPAAPRPEAMASQPAEPSPSSAALMADPAARQLAKNPAGAIRCADPGASRIAAVVAVERFWDSPGFEAISSAEKLNVLLKLSLPAVARMRGPAGSCFVALLPTAEVTGPGGGFQVVDDTGRYAIVLATAENSYDGRFDVTMIDRSHALLMTDPKLQFRWAREALVRRGLISRGATESVVQQAVARVAASIGRPAESPESLDPLLIAALSGPARPALGAAASGAPAKPAASGAARP